MESHRAPTLTVYLDGGCSYCRVAGRIIRALDTRGQIRLVSYRTDVSYKTYGLTEAQVDTEIHAIVHTPQPTMTRGFETFIEICGRLTLCRPAVPLLRMLLATGLGSHAYKWLAHRRPTPKWP